MVFIESRAFTRRLHELAKEDDAAVLASIQSDLLDNPNEADDVTEQQRRDLRKMAEEVAREGERHG